MCGVMTERMQGLPFRTLLNWVLEEYRESASIFGIPADKFYRAAQNQSGWRIFGEMLELPLGPAAGPHTQLAQNIVAAYLCGARYFELKTVQVLDKLEIPKPCIWAEDEGYNTEWSTELSLVEAHAEYVKAWFLIQVVQREIFGTTERNFVFNMSVGYDLAGIKSAPVDNFLEGMKDASDTEIFKACLTVLNEENVKLPRCNTEFINGISPHLCNSVTLSTMHGCPPQEIEAISKYLISEKKLHTVVKMNPTLLGYRFVQTAFNRLGYNYIALQEESFRHDLHYEDGVAILRKLKLLAAEHDLEFGVKLSNTLPVKILNGELPGEEMYLSGRALYPLTINLAYQLAAEFEGELLISYSGGADYFNIPALLAGGIRPVTVVTTLLKPGGYTRLSQIAGRVEGLSAQIESNKLDLFKLKELADQALVGPDYRKEYRPGQHRKLTTKLPLTDCVVAPCTVGCPIEQDISTYIRLVGEGRYEEALAVILAQNPLPFITGTICTHNCSTKCTRLDYDEPVRIRDLKLQAAQQGYQGYLQRLGNSNHRIKPAKRVAIIGAGPSGLAAGYYLARAGFEVTIFDQREQPGGTVQYVIPEFRIPQAAIQGDLELIKQMGVRFELGVDPEFSLADLQASGFAYIYLAIGAGRPNSLPLMGDTEHIIDAISFLTEYKNSQDIPAGLSRPPGPSVARPYKNIQDIQIGKRVAIIGGGNTAVDAARAALRIAQVEEVRIIYRRTSEFMPADREELQMALAEGVILKELLTPLEVCGTMLKCQKMTLGAPDGSQRRQPVALVGEYEEIASDTIILAIGERVDSEILSRNGIDYDQEGQLKLSAALETSIGNVFIGGDARRGPSTVVESIADAKLVAKAIMARENLVWENTLPSVEPSRGEEQERSRLVQISSRKGVLQAHGDTAAEFERCLECDYLCNVCAEVCPNRANIVVEVHSKSLRNVNQIVHIDALCNACGNCATFCPHAGTPYQEKLTLFWSVDDFENSTNPGFILLQTGLEPVFKIRVADGTYQVKFDQEGQTDVPIGPEIAGLVWAVYQQYGYLSRRGG